MAHLPINRVRTIMRTTDGADSINKKAVFLVKLAAELFIKKLAADSCENKGGKKLSYNDIVNVVHGTSRYEFLEYMIPKKITVREFKQRLEKKKKSMESSDDDDSEDSESEN